MGTNKSVAEKAHVKPGAMIAVVAGVPEVVEALGLPRDVVFVEPPEAQIVLLFVSTKAELETRMPPTVRGLAPEAPLWVFYRKGSTPAGLDMSRDDVWAIAERMDLRPLGLVSVDDTWSVFRLKRAG